MDDDAKYLTTNLIELHFFAKFTHKEHQLVSRVTNSGNKDSSRSRSVARAFPPATS